MKTIFLQCTAVIFLTRSELVFDKQLIICTKNMLAGREVRRVHQSSALAAPFVHIF
jgi:hypothetical protein